MIINYTYIKTVIYLGEEVLIPKQINYLAIDKENILWGFKEEPCLLKGSNWLPKKTNDFFEIGSVIFFNNDWEETLVKV